MPFAFVLTDLAGTELSELPAASAKSATRAVRGAGTSEVTIPSWHEDSDMLLAAETLLQVWQISDTDASQRALFAHHRCVAVDEVRTETGGTIKATFADPMWVLGSRLIGKSASGYSRGSAASPVDRGTIISEIVTAANAERPSGIVMGSVATSSTTFVEGWYYKPASEAIAELCAGLDAPDFIVRPTLLQPSGAFATLDVAPVIGTYRPDAVWEYGDGRANVSGYQRAVSNAGLCNRAFSLPSGFPDNATGSVLVREDAGSQAARGLWESVVPSDQPVDGLRDQLLQSHVNVRSTPRQTITFTPKRSIGGSDRVPILGSDWDVGDTFPFRATHVLRDGTRQKRINATMRAYSATVSVESDGSTSFAVTLTP